MTSIPAVNLFCKYTCVAMLGTYLCQLTFFLGLLVLFTRLEEAQRHAFTFGPTVSPEHMGATDWTTL